MDHLCSQFPLSSYVRALPNVPGETAGEARTLGPLDDIASLWQKINAATIPGFTPPLLLDGGYDEATFAADVTTLKNTDHTIQTAEQSLKIEREQRNDLQDIARPALRNYRLANPGDTATYRVYVVVTGGAEAGSNMESVTRA